MAYITNQWLKSVNNSKKMRGHVPVRVVLKTKQMIKGRPVRLIGSKWQLEPVPPTDWSRRHGVVLELIAEKGDGAYKELLLTRRDVDKVLDGAATHGSSNARRDSAVRALDRLTSAELVETLCKIIDNHVVRYARKGDASGLSDVGNELQRKLRELYLRLHTS